MYKRQNEYYNERVTYPDTLFDHVYSLECSDIHAQLRRGKAFESNRRILSTGHDAPQTGFCLRQNVRK